MSSVIAWFGSPQLIDLILGFTVIEAAILMTWRRVDHRNLTRVHIVLMLLPGLFLMLALRAALAGAAWPWIPAALGAALITHLADMRVRLRG